jgi:siroheme decarboxylase
MDAIDQKILNRIQHDFPITSRPYHQLAEELELNEDEVRKRIINLKKQGIIRRIGAIFDSKNLGFKSTLIAMKVPLEKLEEVVKVINNYSGVTHNYQREHDYNIWFTLIAESEGKIKEIIAEISSRTGIKDILDLPAIRFYKLNVRFNF